MFSLMVAKMSRWGLYIGGLFTHSYFIDTALDLLLIIVASYHGERYFRTKEIRADYTIEFEI